MATAPELLDRVGLLIVQEAAPRIALELSLAPFCDSSGINAFVRLWKAAVAAGGELVLLRPHPRLVEVLTRIGLDQLVRVGESFPDAPGPGIRP
ncbi:STAS domain-containing protein [Actinomadura sp. 9N215]|uniref:STAS domain-containing protein n=1 Tax=Actinomadura sp. 9N215 TaxID=3375150 RepID=UPI0037AA35A9